MEGKAREGRREGTCFKGEGNGGEGGKGMGWLAPKPKNQTSPMATPAENDADLRSLYSVLS